MYNSCVAEKQFCLQFFFQSSKRYTLVVEGINLSLCPMSESWTTVEMDSASFSSWNYSRQVWSLRFNLTKRKNSQNVSMWKFEYFKMCWTLCSTHLYWSRPIIHTRLHHPSVCNSQLKGNIDPTSYHILLRFIPYYKEVFAWFFWGGMDPILCSMYSYLLLDPYSL